MSSGLSRGKQLDTSGYGIANEGLPPPESGPIDPRLWFDVPARSLEVEIGSGKGTFLLQQSKLCTNMNFLGFEWAGEFYRYAADRFRRHQLPNVKIVYGDASEFLLHRCAPGVVSVIHIYFSDPWPKKRHHKRRVVQDATLRAMHRALASRGEVRLVTDHEDLWRWYQDLAARNAHLFACTPFDPPESAVAAGEIVGSNFERKYKREGRPFHAMTLMRRDQGA